MVADQLKSPSKRIMFAATTAHFVNDGLMILLPAVLPPVIDEFDLSFSAAGLAVTLFTISATVLQLVTGYIADRVNRITWLSTGLMILGISAFLTGLSTNYIHLILFQCALGIGASFYHPIGYSLLSDTYETGERGKVFGYGTSSGDTAIPVVFITSGFLVSILGWRGVFMLWGIIAIIIAILILFTISDPQWRTRAKNIEKPSKTIIRTLLPVIISMVLMNACYKIASTFTTTYLTLLGLSIELANITAAIMMVIGIIGTLILGPLTGRFEEKNIICVLMILLGALSTILINTRASYTSMVIISLMGFPLLGIWPALYSVIARATGQRPRAFVYGITIAIAWSGGSLLPYIAGGVADIFGLPVVYAIAAVLSLCGAVTAYLTMKKG